MAEKGAEGDKAGGGDSGKETGSTSRSSFRSLLPQQSSKDGLPSSPSPGRNKFSAAHRSKSASQATSFIDSDSYVVVGMGESQDAAGLDSPPPPRDTASSGTDSRAALGRELARDSSTDGGVRAEDATAEGDRDSAVDSDSAKEKDKEKKKETSRFFSPPKMRGTMFPFDQIAVPMSSHRQKNMELHRIFRSLDGSEKLVDDYSCALHRDILVHGRVYITQNWLCFYANIFTWETLLTIPFSRVTAITKERTAFVFPNAVQVTTTSEKYTFSSLMSRDITYNVLFKVWQNSLLNEHLSPLELVKAARRASGDITDVGTADELWGSEDGCPSATVADSHHLMPKVTTSLPTVLPTHVEIMPNPENSPHFSVTSVSQPAADGDESSPLTAPDVQDYGIRAVDSEGNVEAVKSEEQVTLQDLPRGRRPANGHMDTQKANNKDSVSHSASRGGSDRQQPTPTTPAVGELPEMVSMGGESLGSFSEDFETVSFAEESGEVPCGCSEHVGRTIINDVYTADVETIFQLLFTDANFFRDFLMARNTINIDIGEWQEQSDSSKLRDLHYTVALNYSFGPKFSPTTEHQVYSSSGQPGLKHLVHTEVMNRNIPYAETFFVSCQYCMTRVAHDKMRLRITANINYRKSCWGVVKNLIEKNAGDGLRSYYNHLDSFLKEHLASLPAHCRTKHRRKRQRHVSRLRHRKTAQPSPSPPSPTHHQPTRESPTPSLPSSPLSPLLPTHPSTATLHSLPLNGSTPTEPEGHQLSLPEKSDKRSTFPQVNMALTLLLGILIVSNMALYHHLMSYQSSSSSTSSSRPLPVDPLTEQFTEHVEWPTSDQEWIALTRRHLESHEADRQQWLDTLAALVTTLDQAATSLDTAKRMLTEKIQFSDKRFPHSRPPPSSPSSSSPSSRRDKTQTVQHAHGQTKTGNVI